MSQVKPIRVLLIEDEPGDAQLTQIALRQTSAIHFEVTWVSSLNGVRQQLAVSRFDVLLLDLSLPDSEGLDTVSAALQVAKTTPIIILTGRDDTDFALQALDAGAADYMIKGDFGHNGLIRSIRYTLHRLQMEEHNRVLMNAINTAPSAIVVTDREARIEWANPAFSQLTGYSLEEAYGHRPAELVKSGLQDNVFYETMWRSILAGQVWRGEIINKHKSGDLYHEELIISPVHDEVGEIRHFIGIKQDISERKRIEQARQEALDLLQKIASQVPGFVYQFRRNPEGHCCLPYASDGIYDLFRVSPEAVRTDASPAFAVVHPDDMQALLASTQASAQDLTPWHFEFRVKLDDTVRWLSGNSIPQREANGSVLWHGFMSDVTPRRQAEEAIRQSETKLRTLYASTPDAVMLLDEQGFFDCNKATLEIFGCASEAEFIAKHPADLSPPKQPSGNNSQALAQQKITLALKEGYQRFEWVHKRADNGATFPAEVLLSAMSLDGRRVLQAVVRDISVRKQAEEELRLAAMVYQHSSEAMTVSDADNRIIAINPTFTRVTGYSLDEVIGKNPKILSSGRHDSAFYQAMWNELETKNYWQGEIWNRRKNGEIYVEYLTINNILKYDGTVHRRVALFSDITEKKRSEELIWNQAHFDALTQLPNRLMFRDRLEQGIKRSQRAELPLALFFIDLDHFKEVNDTLGHDKGDSLLIEATRRISACVRSADTLARLGGDEFTVILPELSDPLIVERIAQAIIKSLCQPYTLGSEIAYLSASIGITLYPNDALTIEDLLKNADQAMYAAKNAGRNGFCFFTSAMQEAAKYRLLLFNDLRNTVTQNQLELYYQPIITLTTGRIHKAEALLRWRHPNRGKVRPDEFIPLAEESGLIIEIGDWVFKKAASQVKHWRKHYDISFQISINTSPAQYRLAADTAGWLDYLQAIKLPAQSITLEITEGLLLDASSAVTQKLRDFHDTGIQVAIDDFGTGYSSLSYLRKFEIDYLKIDQSFIKNLTPGSTDQALCEAIIAMAHKLGIEVIAEGVETKQQLELLTEMSCDYAQGFLFSSAVLSDEFELLLSKQGFYAQQNSGNSS